MTRSRYIKYHGLGNDYLVLAEGPPPGPEAVRRLCARHTGFGADGVLVPTPGDGADHGARIFNPDGGEAEKSGNGLRILARFLVDRRGAPAAFTISTLGGRVACRVSPEDVELDMGPALLAPADVPVDLPGPRAVEVPVEVEGAALRFTAIGLGNPHCVLFTEAEALDALPWRAWGAALERHPLFPRRTNVQLARVSGPQTLELRIWERGAGETSASGSSACAVAAAAVLTRRVEAGAIALDMPGGRLHVRVGEGLSLTLRGPVAEVGEVSPSPALFGG